MDGHIAAEDTGVEVVVPPRSVHTDDVLNVCDLQEKSTAVWYGVVPGATGGAVAIPTAMRDAKAAKRFASELLGMFDEAKKMIIDKMSNMPDALVNLDTSDENFSQNCVELQGEWEEFESHIKSQLAHLKDFATKWPVTTVTTNL